MRRIGSKWTDVTYARIEGPLGPMVALARAGGLAGLFFLDEPRRPVLHRSWRAAPRAPVFRAAARQLREYFAGRRRAFDLPLRPEGTPFQLRVWRGLRAIPYGQVTTYGAMARRVGVTAGSRAVGAAVGRNPLGIVIPCHRMVGAGGGLTGYGGGLWRKRALLELEGAGARSRPAPPHARRSA